MIRTIVGAMILVMGFSSGAGADPKSKTKVQAEDAADHHVSAQGNYKGGLRNSWEHRFGSRKSAPNITGITAHGLLAVYKLTGLKEHQNSALRAARSLVSAFQDGGWRKRRPYTQDIEFLAAAGFIIDAGRWFKVTRSRYSAVAYVDFVLSGRKRQKIPSMAGWDLASAIRSALAVGQTRFAREMFQELVRRQAEWDPPTIQGKPAVAPMRDLSHGSLLWTLAELKKRTGLTPEQESLAAGLMRSLVRKQQPGGAWLDPTGKVYVTQTTGYAVLGLSRWKEGKAAAARGRAWLTKVALADRRYFLGGRIWATTYSKTAKPEKHFSSEIQSEAMMALATGR